MKKIVTLITSIIITSSLWAQSWEDAIYKDQFLQQPQERYLLKSATQDEDASYGDWDITYNKLDLTLNPEVFYVKGTVLFKFKVLTNNLSGITIDLSNELTINSIKVNNNSLVFTHQNEKVTIKLQQPLNKGETGFFTVNYEGKPTTTGFGSFTQHFHGDSIPSLETLSEPYGAKEWWPCKQSLIDKIDSIDVIVHSPEKYETASNGLLFENSVKNGIRTCHWKHRHPIATYLVFLTTTTYKKYFEEATLSNGTKVPIWEYVFPSYLETAQKNTPVTASLIELYSDLFIDYPFKDEKYGHAQFSWGGGMEHQTMSSMGGLNTDLIAHELAHQWFGDFITCGNWHEIWLNEGFATFLTGLYYNKLNPDPWWRVWREKVIAKAVSVPDGSVYVSDTTDINLIFSSRLSYNKAAYVLHMLRGQLGDEKFFTGMKNYLTDPRVTNGFATTNLFRENMEAASDTSLSEFFNDWIYGEGFPVYSINCYNTGPELQVNIEQSPSTPKAPFFEMKIPISVYTNGQRKMLWFKNENEQDTFEVTLNTSPDSVLIDEDLWLLGVINRNVNSVPFIHQDELRVYYNSYNQLLMLTIPGFDNGEVTIYNLNGQALYKYLWEKQNPSISTSMLRKGVYLLNFKSNNKSIDSKFVVN